MCYKGIVLDDLTVRDSSGTSPRLTTCGNVSILAKARSVMRQVQAGGDVRVQGYLEAAVESEGTVHLSQGSRLRGAVRARGLVVEEGAVIEGEFTIGLCEARSAS